jgi:hypothetical protein
MSSIHNPKTNNIMRTCSPKAFDCSELQFTGKPHLVFEVRGYRTNEGQDICDEAAYLKPKLGFLCDNGNPKSCTLRFCTYVVDRAAYNAMARLEVVDRASCKPKSVWKIASLADFTRHWPLPDAKEPLFSEKWIGSLGYRSQRRLINYFTYWMEEEERERRLCLEEEALPEEEVGFVEIVLDWTDAYSSRVGEPSRMKSLGLWSVFWRCRRVKNLPGYGRHLLQWSTEVGPSSQFVAQEFCPKPRAEEVPLDLQQQVLQFLADYFH